MHPFVKSVIFLPVMIQSYSLYYGPSKWKQWIGVGYVLPPIFTCCSIYIDPQYRDKRMYIFYCCFKESPRIVEPDLSGDVKR